MYAARKLKKVGKYQVGRLLGVGGFGKVYLGSDTETNKPVAIKFIDRAMVQLQKLEEYVTREIETLKMMSHKHIVKLVEVIVKPNIYYLVMELAPNGELFDKIVEARKFDETTARRYFQQLISAVHYCHSKGVAHRDLKAENLLLGAKDDLKVCDFGLCRPAFTQDEDGQHRHHLMTSMAGSQDYQAPEMMGTEEYHGFGCDIWSCGVILYFMMCGYLPFAEKNEMGTKKRIQSGEYRSQTAQFRALSAEARSLIEAILVVDVRKRAGIEDIIEHPWFTMGGFDPASVAMGPASPMSDSGHRRWSISDQSLLSPMRNRGRSDSSSFSPGPEVGHGPPRDLLQKAFRSCNVASNGFLTAKDIRDVLIKYNDGKEVADSETAALMSHFDLNEKGQLTEEAFVAAWSGPSARTLEDKLKLTQLVTVFQYEMEHELLQTFRAAFDAMDIDESGVITQSNLKENKELTKNFDSAELERLIADIGGEGASFERFVELMTKTSLISNNPKLLTVGALFEAYDFEGAKTQIKSGFTVAGLRQTIYNKLVKVGADEDGTFRSTLKDAPESEFFTYVEYKPQSSNHNNIPTTIGLQLLPTQPGYTRLRTYRIAGTTSNYQEWFKQVRFVLQDEIAECTRDTAPSGESELL